MACGYAGGNTSSLGRWTCRDGVARRDSAAEGEAVEQRRRRVLLQDGIAHRHVECYCGRSGQADELERWVTRSPRTASRSLVARAGQSQGMAWHGMALTRVHITSGWLGALELALEIKMSSKSVIRMEGANTHLLALDRRGGDAQRVWCPLTHRAASPTYPHTHTCAQPQGR
jgi:hypothetical protein